MHRWHTHSPGEYMPVLRHVAYPRRRARFVRARTRRWLIWVLVLGPALFVTSCLFCSRPRKAVMDGITALRYRFHPMLRAGRVVPGPDCYGNKRNIEPLHRAIVTYMLTDDYLPLLEHLHCSVTKSNPGLEFVVMVTTQISPSTVVRIKERGIVIVVVEDWQYPNSFEPRFRYNWLKIRAFQLPYDAILLVDSDTVVLEDVSHLFNLPTRFAAVEDQVNWAQEWKYPRGVRILQGGVLFIRPCMAVARHMEALLEENTLLQFRTGNAEQEFFSWYFKSEAIILPMRYNVLTGSLGAMGDATPAILHFTQHKPFGTFSAAIGPERFLCTEVEVVAGRSERSRSSGGWSSLK